MAVMKTPTQSTGGKRHALLFRLIPLLLLLAGPGAAPASAALSILPNGESYWTVQLDNDLFNHTDENYTNGFRLSWLSSKHGRDEFNWLQQQLANLSGDRTKIRLLQLLSGFDGRSEITYKYGFSLTQLMFTPTNRTALEAPPGQRPYAGWLGLGFSVHVQDDNTVNMVEFNVGTVGPNSLAKQAQDYIHDLRGFDRFLGWGSQTGNELTGELIFTQYRKVLKPLDRPAPGAPRFFDAFTEWGFAAGNFRTELMTGAVVRSGWNLPVDFSDPRLSLRSYSQQAVPAVPGGGFLRNLSAYLQYGYRGTAVLHDRTLDGSLFHHDDSVVRSRPLVGEHFLGVGLRVYRLELSYADTLRSREFYGQAKAQRYGSVTLRLHVNWEELKRWWAEHREING